MKIRTSFPLLYLVISLVSTGCYSPLKLSNRSATSDLAQGQPGGAERMTATGSNSAAKLIKKADDALAEGEFLLAATNYKQALEVAPNHAGAHHGLAIAFDKLKLYRKSEQHYMSALGNDPGNADIMYNLAYSYQLQDRIDEAANYYQMALETDRQHGRAAEKLGEILASNGELEQARRIMQGVCDPETIQNVLAIANTNPHPGLLNDPLATENPFAFAQSERDQSAVSPATREIQQHMREVRNREEQLRDQVPQNAHGMVAGNGRPSFQVDAPSSASDFGDQMRNAFDRIDDSSVDRFRKMNPQLANVEMAMQANAPQPTSIPSFTTPPNASIPEVTATEVASSAQNPGKAQPVWPTIKPFGLAENTASDETNKTNRSFESQQAIYNSNQETSHSGNQFELASASQVSEQPFPSDPTRFPASPKQLPSKEQLNSLALEQAERQAASLGLSVGPGAMFPLVETNEQTSSRESREIQAPSRQQSTFKANPQDPAVAQAQPSRAESPAEQGQSFWSHPQTASSIPESPSYQLQSPQDLTSSIPNAPRITPGPASSPSTGHLGADKLRNATAHAFSNAPQPGYAPSPVAETHRPSATANEPNPFADIAFE